MIDVLTPMRDGSIALQSAARLDSDDYSNRAVETFITGGLRFKKGARVERTALARGILRTMGLDRLASQRGTYTGKGRGKHADCILVRVDGRKKAEPFKPELWKLV